MSDSLSICQKQNGHTSAVSQACPFARRGLVIGGTNMWVPCPSHSVHHRLSVGMTGQVRPA